jgi:hypothetical protein
MNILWLVSFGWSCFVVVCCIKGLNAEVPTILLGISSTGAFILSELKK